MIYLSTFYNHYPFCISSFSELECCREVFAIQFVTKKLLKLGMNMNVHASNSIIHFKIASHLFRMTFDTKLPLQLTDVDILDNILDLYWRFNSPLSINDKLTKYVNSGAVFCSVLFLMYDYWYHLYSSTLIITYC